MQTSIRILGIHLAGANTRKSSAVRGSLLLQKCRSGVEDGSTHDLYCRALAEFFPGIPRTSTSAEEEQVAAASRMPLLWEAYSADIGPSAHRDGDSRFIEVVADLGPVDVVVIDAPLTLPPCVACPLPCPGTRECVVPEVVFDARCLGAKTPAGKRRACRTWPEGGPA